MLLLTTLLTVGMYYWLVSIIYRVKPSNLKFKQFISDLELYSSIEKGIRDVVAVDDELPRFGIKYDKDVTMIYVENSSLFEPRLKKFEEALEAGLPENYLISSFAKNSETKEYEVEIFDSRLYRGKRFTDIEQLDWHLDRVPAGAYQFKVGGKHIDMRETPHFLIGGASGSGKTNLLYLLMIQALWGKAEIHVVDVKLEMSAIADSVPFYYRYYDVMDLLDKLIHTIQERTAYMADNGIRDCSDRYNAVYLFFDELSAFSLACPSVKEQKEFQRKIGQIILMGRKAGVFGVISGQYHTNETSLSVSARESLSVKIALGRANKTALEGLGMNVEEFDMANRYFRKGEGFIYGLPEQVRPQLLQVEYLDFDVPGIMSYISQH